MSGEGDVAPKFDYPAMDFETAQPYPVWERARGECPVIHVSGMSLGVDRHDVPGDALGRRRARPARRRDVLVVDQRRAHRPVHGRPHPRHGRQGAPQLPQPRRTRVPGVAAREVGRLDDRPDDRCAARRHRAARSRRPRARHHVEVPGAGHLRHRRRARRGQCAVPRVGRADQRGSAAPRGRHEGVPRDARVPRAARGGTAREPVRRPAERPRPRRGRRRAAVGRAHLRLPAPAAPRGRGDDVPRHGQRARPRCSRTPT